MSFGSAFPFTWEEEINFITKCQQSVNIQSIPPQNAVPAFDLSELGNDEKANENVEKDRIIIGVHPPSIPILPFTFTKHTTIMESKIIDKSKIIHGASKKRKLSDWRTGHNKRIDSTINESINSNSKDNKKKKELKDIRIPTGCEKLFNSETGELVDELSDLDMKLVSQIGYELLNKLDNIGWNDIAGLELEKAKIKEAVIWPLTRIDLFSNDSLLKPPKGVLLFGPPGTGKTMLAKAIAAESNANFFSISPSCLQSKWIGESAKLVKTMFSIARFMAPSIVFIDECDSLLSKRGTDSTASTNANNTLKTQFLMEFQGARSNSNDGYVLIVGATNFPEAIDDAARRRLSKRLYIPLPDKYGRKQLFLNLLKKADINSGHTLSDQQIDILVGKTKGYSGSDISDVAEEAAMAPLRELKASLETIDKNDFRPLKFEDFELALRTASATNTMEDIKKYQRWNHTFGAKLR